MANSSRLLLGSSRRVDTPSGTAEGIGTHICLRWRRRVQLESKITAGLVEEHEVGYRTTYLFDYGPANLSAQKRLRTAHNTTLSFEKWSLSL